MITTEELQAALTYEFESDTQELVYRKYTTDLIPDYVLRLDNALDGYYVRAFPTMPDYIQLTYYDTNRPVVVSDGILLEPTGSVRLLVTFDLDTVNLSTTLVPTIQFDAQALEEQEITTTPPTSSVPPPPQTPFTGGSGYLPPIGSGTTTEPTIDPTRQQLI